MSNDGTPGDTQKAPLIDAQAVLTGAVHAATRRRHGPMRLDTFS
jgi:hypothetical protein